jgi:hypothetical protein
MKITAYVLLIFGISLSLYLLGYPSVFLALISQVGSEQPITSTLFTSLIAVFTNPVFLIGAAFAGITGFLTGGGNFSVIYMIPLLMLIAIANVFVLPTAYLLQMDMNPIIQLIINGFMNTLLMLTIIEFVRGG